MISTTPSLCFIYHFPNPFPNITWSAGESSRSICRWLVPKLHGSIYKEILLDIIIYLFEVQMDIYQVAVVLQ
jgi:hypothetical protein